MTNLVFDDREGAFNLRVGLAIGVAFVMIWFIGFFGIGHFEWTLPVFIYIGALIGYRQREKKSVAKDASRINAYMYAFYKGPDCYGTFAVKYGKLIFTLANGKEFIVLDGEQTNPVLKITFQDAVSTEHFKCVRLHIGFRVFVMPIEVWNTLYDQLPSFTIQSDHLGEVIYFNRSPVLIIAFFMVVAAMPLGVKIFLNLIFGDSLMRNVTLMDYSLVALSAMGSLWQLLRKKRPQPTEEDVRRDRCVVQPSEVKGFKKTE